QRAAWQQAEYTVHAPIRARVQEVFFRPGEVVSSGTPVMALLSPDAIKVRFYIPESRRAHFEVGQTVWIRQTGTEPVKAVIRFIGQAVEHTPPVIFSERTREALVFAADAWPLEPGYALKPGMPAEVRP
ncbi:MAG: HlyD family secretion protein, partial [Gammaproteobacteria bacterium]